jgi:glycosyltransferase involved in cell wall biosynthesis
MPAVSVITLCYKYERYLEECLKSVAAQTYRDYEHIVLNVDDDPQVDELCGKYWRTFVFEARRTVRSDMLAGVGLSTGRNELVFLACGDYIVNLDADDRVKPTFLEKMIAQAAPETLVCCGLQEFEQGSNAGWPSLPIGYEELKQANRLFNCTLFPKKAFVEVGGYDTALDNFGYEDWELWLSLTRNGCSVKIVPELLFEYRVHKDSLMFTTQAQNEARMKYIQEKHR